MKNLITLLFIATVHFVSAQEAPGKYPFTSSRLVTNDDVSDKPPEELRIMRNEIFARHGHTFKADDLKNHFSSQSWYKATVPNAATLLTDIEKTNVDFIKAFEDKILATADFDDFFSLFTKAVNTGDLAKLKTLVLYKEFYDTPEEFEQAYSIHQAELKQGLKTGDANGDDTTRKLFYGEFYNGVQYKWIEFHKQGCCWYIFGFGRAG